jgi:ribosomal protein S18 acetylase RimI-like enzyme
MRITDFKEVYELWTSVGLWVRPVAEEQERFVQTVEYNPDTSFVLRDEQNNIVGTIIGAFNGRAASIVRLAVHTDIQGQGWGKKLLEHLEDALRKKSVKKIEAHVHESNAQVVDFYKKRGFEIDPLIVLNKTV